MAVPFSPKPVFRSIAGILAGWGGPTGDFSLSGSNEYMMGMSVRFFRNKNMLLNAVRTKITESREKDTYYVCIYGSIYIHI